MLKRNESENRMNLRTAAALRLVLDKDRLENEIEFQRSLANSFESSSEPDWNEAYQQAMSDIEGLKDLWDILDQLETEYAFA
jgi:CHASE1-domain containing sensor protein